MTKNKHSKKVKDIKKQDDVKKQEKNNELNEKIELLQKENEKIKKQLEEKEEILKNTQLQYLTLKNDFDMFTKRVKENEEKLKEEIFEKIILKFLPIIDDFVKSYDHLPEEFKEHKWTEGLSLVNKKLETFLSDYNIEPIKSVGEQVNDLYHEVIGIEQVENEEEKGNILKEVVRGYLVKKGDNIKALRPAKVIIGQ